MFAICRVDIEGLSSEESSLLAGAKYFSDLREVEDVNSLVAKVKISSLGVEFQNSFVSETRSSESSLGASCSFSKKTRAHCHIH